jgi:hypothetical protein
MGSMGRRNLPCSTVKAQTVKWMGARFCNNSKASSMVAESLPPETATATRSPSRIIWKRWMASPTLRKSVFSRSTDSIIGVSPNAFHLTLTFEARQPRDGWGNPAIFQNLWNAARTTDPTYPAETEFKEQYSRKSGAIQCVAFRKLVMLHAANALSDLAGVGNSLEALTGDRKGQYAIRVALH